MSISATVRKETMPAAGGTSIPLAAERVARAKAAYTTRRVDFRAAHRLLTGDLTPRAGDLVLARIERLGQHSRIELASGRRAHLHLGDEIVVSYGARYAPDQFEAFVPEDLGPCDLVASGGVASECRVRHSRMKRPTRIRPLGLLADRDERRLNLSHWAEPKAPSSGSRPPVVAVVGTMMNAGKTTCAGNLILGLKGKGLRVGAAKVTGTGAGCDRWYLTDAGAEVVLDFTDMGVPSTFGLAPLEVERIFSELTAQLTVRGADVIVLEVADGLYQKETAGLLVSEAFRSRCEGLLFAAGDALGAVAGVEHLERLGHKVLAVGGALTASPLAVREAEQVLRVSVVSSRDLCTGCWWPFAEQMSPRPAGRRIDFPRGAAEAVAEWSSSLISGGRPVAATPLGA